MNTRRTLATLAAAALLALTACGSTGTDPSAPAHEDNRPTTSQVKRLADTSLAVIEAGEKVTALTQQALNLVVDYTENPFAVDAVRLDRVTDRLHTAVAVYNKAYDAYWDAREEVVQ